MADTGPYRDSRPATKVAVMSNVLAVRLTRAASAAFVKCALHKRMKHEKGVAHD